LAYVVVCKVQAAKKIIEINVFLIIIKYEDLN
jgi:hypothetical protein